MLHSITHLTQLKLPTNMLPIAKSSYNNPLVLIALNFGP